MNLKSLFIVLLITLSAQKLYSQPEAPSSPSPVDTVKNIVNAALLNMFQDDGVFKTKEQLKALGRKERKTVNKNEPVLKKSLIDKFPWPSAYNNEKIVLFKKNISIAALGSYVYMSNFNLSNFPPVDDELQLPIKSNLKQITLNPAEDRSNYVLNADISSLFEGNNATSLGVSTPYFQMGLEAANAVKTQKHSYLTMGVGTFQNSLVDIYNKIALNKLEYYEDWLPVLELWSLYSRRPEYIEKYILGSFEGMAIRVEKSLKSTNNQVYRGDISAEGATPIFKGKTEGTLGYTRAISKEAKSITYDTYFFTTPTPYGLPKVDEIKANWDRVNTANEKTELETVKLYAGQSGTFYVNFGPVPELSTNVEIVDDISPKEIYTNISIVEANPSTLAGQYSYKLMIHPKDSFFNSYNGTDIHEDRYIEFELRLPQPVEHNGSKIYLSKRYKIHVRAYTYPAIILKDGVVLKADGANKWKWEIPFEYQTLNQTLVTNASIVSRSAFDTLHKLVLNSSSHDLAVLGNNEYKIIVRGYIPNELHFKPYETLNFSYTMKARNGAYFNRNLNISLQIPEERIVSTEELIINKEALVKAIKPNLLLVTGETVGELISKNTTEDPNSTPIINTELIRTILVNSLNLQYIPEKGYLVRKQNLSDSYLATLYNSQ